MGLDQVSDTDGGDHAVEDEGDTADGGRGHHLDDRCKLRAEGQDDRDDGSEADDRRIIDLGQRQDAGVLAVGRVGRCAEQGGKRGGKAVAGQGSVQAGILDEVPADSGGDGGDVSDVLHHGCKGDRDDRDDGGDEKAVVHVSVREDREDRAVVLHREADPGGLLHLREVNEARKSGDDVGGDDAQQNRDDLHHASAPDVADDDDHDGDQSDRPVRLTVGDSGLGQVQADADDDGSRHDGREELHDPVCAEGPEQSRKDQVHQACAGDAEAGVAQKLRLPVGCDRRISCKEGKGRAKECRDLSLGNQVEEQGAEARPEERGGYRQPRKERRQDRGAKHGKHVLEAENQDSALSQLTRIIDWMISDLLSFHECFSSLI